jgi:uncharacterized phage protein gp47/JayE
VTDYGETSTGFRSKSYDEASEELKARLRARIDPGLTLDDKDWLGNAVAIFADREALIWEALEVARNQFDPDNAEGAGAVALAALTGTVRRQATRGLVTCTLNLDASKTFAPGTLVAHVTGQPDNRWVNRDTVTSSGAGNYAGQIFIAEAAGVYAAPFGTLAVIAQTASGWNSVTNPADALPGSDIESIEDLMVRREEELSASGSGTALAIDEAVSAVTNVFDVKVFYNDTNATVGVLPPHNIRVLIWDSGLANNDAVAQVIFNSKSAGAPTYGSYTGNGVNLYGEPITANFDRVTPVICYVAVTVQCPTGTNVGNMQTLVKEAITKLWPTKIGESAYVGKVIAGPASIDDVNFVVSMTMGTSPAPVGSQIVAADTQILRLSTANITVTVNIV